MSAPRIPALVALAAVALLAAPASGAVPPEAYDSLDGVTYLFAAGAHGSGRMEGLLAAPAPGGDAATLAFDGCSFAQLRPEKGYGRVAVLALVRDAAADPVVVQADFGDLEPPASSLPTIALNGSVDGAALDGTKAYPAVPVDAATVGAVTLTVDGFEVKDPIGDGDLRGMLLVTGQGFRDDATGAPTAPAEDQEAHIRIVSPPGVQPVTHSFGFANKGDLPTGATSLSSAYAHVQPFNNTKFGGQGRLELHASATAPPGANELLVAVRAPDGAIVANTTISPSLLEDAQADLGFPLDRFGAYTLEVTGKAAMLEYTALFTLEPPPAFELELWWEEVAFGRPARQAFADCQQATGAGVSPVATSVGRNDPPGFPLAAVLVAATASAATVMVLVKLGAESAAAASFRRGYRKG